MKHLLEKWATLEPSLCKRETRPNKDWHEFEDYSLFSAETKAWYLVYSDSFIENYKLGKEGMFMRIQWVVQQAIIEKGWYFQITYNRKYYSVEMGLCYPSPRFTKSYESLVEVLLTAYLAELEASVNP